MRLLGAAVPGGGLVCGRPDCAALFADDALIRFSAGSNIYLKLENLQPSGSFKSRGVGNLMFRAAKASSQDDIHFYCSSGGNAGLACATVGGVAGPQGHHRGADHDVAVHGV